MLEEWIIHYGYPGLFGLLMFGIMGVPVPEELLLMYAGYNVSLGHTNLFLTISAGVLGSICGITVSYLVGLYVGLPTLHKFGYFFHITDEQLQRAHDWFEKWGKWTLVVGYFIPGIRHMTALVAGTSKLAWHEFAAYAYIGAIIWANTFVLAGFFIGGQTPKLVALLHPYLKGISLIAAIIIGLVLLVTAGMWLLGKKILKK